LTFNGKPVGSIDDLHRCLDATQIGKKVTLKVFRRGITRDLTVIPAEMK
jgi:S1-C subfamily serine protease